jgi:hypothetical protein
VYVDGESCETEIYVNIPKVWISAYHRGEFVIFDGYADTEGWFYFDITHEGKTAGQWFH